jgi:hypothetical protein
MFHEIVPIRVKNEGSVLKTEGRNHIFQWLFTHNTRRVLVHKTIFVFIVVEMHQLCFRSNLSHVIKNTIFEFSRGV